MANLGQKDGVFHIRFRFRGKEFKKSLKTREESAAKAVAHLIELTLHRLHTGQLLVPDDVDPGDFIVSGGVIPTIPEPKSPPVIRPTTRAIADKFTEWQRDRIAPTYHYSQAMHLRHLLRHLGDRADWPCDQIGFRDLDEFLKSRLRERNPNTVERERITLLQFGKWAVQRGYLDSSPAEGLEPVRGEVDPSPFRTIEEIERLLARGGMDQEHQFSLWDCLYLNPVEIAELLATVRANAANELGFLLHAIPAYTGMRRGEVLKLRWLDVDFDGGYVTARSRKQSRRKRESIRRIPMHPELKPILERWHGSQGSGQFVIGDDATSEPIPPDRANRLFWQPMRGTKWCLDNNRDLFKIGFHTYRHSIASNLAAAGVDQRVIDELMGHTTAAMAKRYRHLFPQHKNSAIASFSLVAARTVAADPNPVEGNTPG